MTTLVIPPNEVEIYRGTTRGLEWEFWADEAETTPFNITGYSFQLTFSDRQDTLIQRIKTTDPSSTLTIVTSPTSKVIWTPTAAMTRLIPVGWLSKYELEARNSPIQDIWAWGKVLGIGGINDDA